ncbi:MAG: TetR/AcrR family transcriptional regulator [Bacteroidales bacterium]|nr:TetR/AcrR family transcriptional regulator [Bacteroidales bacterium]
MTDKQLKILQVALELFAKNGYSSTSTGKIAKQAGVSEGLIFRHFGNKEGLLEAVLQLGEEKIKSLFAEIVFETEPKEVIKKVLELGLKMIENKEDADFWKLQYKIKWEVERYNEQKMEPVEHALNQAFLKLGYKSPELEAKLLLITFDGIATRYFLQENFNLEGIVEFLHTKYLT